MNFELPYHQQAPQFLQSLPQGAFLSVQAQNRINTMTIGWGSIGYIWRLPIVMVAVRASRYTHELLEQSGEFTVSTPLNQDFKQALAIAGTKSGRDIDKFAELNLIAKPGQTVASPAIDNCGLIIEAKTRFKQAMDPQNLDPAIKAKFYADEDYHTLYFGEITACYYNENQRSKV